VPKPFETTALRSAVSVRVKDPVQFDGGPEIVAILPLRSSIWYGSTAIEGPELALHPSACKKEYTFPSGSFTSAAEKLAAAW
jgi:hypothetical protein